MNKEKILEKSRKENLMGDEREKLLEKNSFAWVTISASIAFLALMIASYFKDINIDSAKIMFYAMILGQFIYRLVVYKKENNKFVIFGGVLVVISVIILVMGLVLGM